MNSYECLKLDFSVKNLYRSFRRQILPKNDFFNIWSDAASRVDFEYHLYFSSKRNMEV
jgi:hypothetical protein